MTRPPFTKYPEITGDRITLSQIRAEDLEAIMEISFYDAMPAKSLQQARDMQVLIEMDYNKGESIHWGIIDNSTKNIVGTCGYYRGFEDAAGELGCVLLRKFYGMGYMSEAMTLAIEFGLNHLQLNRIWARTSRDNYKAIKLLERTGFTKSAELDAGEIDFEFQKR